MTYHRNLRYSLMNGQAIRVRGQGVVILPNIGNISSRDSNPVSTITGTIRDRGLVDRAERVEKPKKASKKSSKKSSKKAFKSLKFNF